MERVRSIDVFRGAAILLMIFFTLTQVLSENLPDILKHNKENSVHFGDFVLPMFLFASGMSLVFFVRKHRANGKERYILDVVERSGVLLMIACTLSIFSTGEILGMDVIMLSLILFLGTILVFSLRQTEIIGLILFVFFLHVVLVHFGIEPIMPNKHLGGYPAALFYFPIMLSGMLFGKEIEKKDYTGMKKLGGIFFVIFLVFALLSPVDKLSASPSFMALSIVLSMAFFIAIEWIMGKGIELKALQWIGRKPLRYWILMFIAFIVPLGYFIIVANGGGFPLQLDWPIGILLSIGVIFWLTVLSSIIDLGIASLKKRNSASR